MGLIVGFGDFGIGDKIDKAEDLYRLLLDLCGDQLDWENILNKPELYEKHEVYNKEEIDDLINDIAPGDHTHEIADVTGLQDALDVRYTKEENDDLLDEKADVDHTHTVADIEGLNDAIKALGVQIVEELPFPVIDGLVYILHGSGESRFKTFISAGGGYVPLDAVTYSALSTALAAYQTKLTGLPTQYVKADGTYGTFDKTAIGLGNVDNTKDLDKPISNAQAIVNAQKANDADVLKKTGNQTKTSGVLTFALSPVVPTPTESQQAANKGYVDSAIQDNISVVFNLNEW